MARLVNREVSDIVGVARLGPGGWRAIASLAGRLFCGRVFRHENASIRWGAWIHRRDRTESDGGGRQGMEAASTLGSLPRMQRNNRRAALGRSSEGSAIIVISFAGKNRALGMRQEGFAVGVG